MYPQFHHYLVSTPPAPTASLAGVVDALPEVRRASRTSIPFFASQLHRVAQTLAREADLVEGLRPAITRLWAKALSDQHAPVASIRSQDRWVLNAYTPVEIEITKKALVAGMGWDEIQKLAVDHPTGGALTGRWATLVDAVITHAFSSISEVNSSVYQTEYWLLFACPNGSEHHASRSFGFLGRFGITTLWVNANLYFTFSPFNRDSNPTVPLFAYVGSQVAPGALRGGTQVAMHLPECRKLYPKKSFLVGSFKFHGKEGIESSLYAHSRRDTIMVDANPSNEICPSLSGSFFPSVFSGPHLQTRFFRALTLLGHLTNHPFKNPINEIAALLAVAALGDDTTIPLFTETRTQVFIPQPETVSGLIMDRGAGVHLTGATADNSDRVSSLLSRYDDLVTNSYS